MDWKFIFLSFQGRLNRKPYWLGTIALLSLVVIGVFGVMFLAGGGGGIAAIGVIYLLLLWPTLAIGVKRLHDRNKSAWWLVVFYVAPTLGRIEKLWSRTALRSRRGTACELRCTRRAPIRHN